MKFVPLKVTLSSISIPPPLLVAELWVKVPPVITAEAIAALKQHSWPGNVRELRNVMSRLVIVYSGKQVTRHDIEPLLDIGQPEVEQNPTALADMERIHLIKVLTMSRGVVGGRKGAAAVLNVPKSTLQYKLHKHGLNPQDYR